MLNKVLKAVIGLVLLSMLYGVFLGLTNKSDVIITETQIDAPVEVVYDFIIDADKSKSWLIDLTSIEQVSGDSVEAGAKYVLVFMSGKNQIIITETLTDVVENERFAFDLENEFITGDVEISLSPSDGGTLVREENNYSGKGFLSRALMGISKSSFKKSKRLMYDKLKEVAEAEAN